MIRHQMESVSIEFFKCPVLRFCLSVTGCCGSWCGLSRTLSIYNQRLTFLSLWECCHEEKVQENDGRYVQGEADVEFLIIKQHVTFERNKESLIFRNKSRNVSRSSWKMSSPFSAPLAKLNALGGRRQASADTGLLTTPAWAEVLQALLCLPQEAQEEAARLHLSVATT